MKIIRIVIVENDEDEQLFMREAFQDSGLFDILAMCRNGNQLEEWIGLHMAELPEIILSDLNMPGKDGYDVIRFITGSPVLRHIPVYITSTSSTSSLIDKCIAMGATRYMVKPETFTDYLPFVRKLHSNLSSEEIIN
jgi:CheY-like chemotaxis protein